MPRRFWWVLLFVAVTLAVAPMLPTWLPAAWESITQVDLSATADAAWHALELAGAFAVEHRVVMAAVAGSTMVLVLLTAAVRAFRNRRARRGARSAVPRSGYTAETIVAPSAAPAARSTGFPSPQPRSVAATTAGTARARQSGRGTMVRRLSADGHSTAEISRATRVGQDAVRTLLRGAGAR